MRRIVGLTLVVVGTFVLGMAGLSRFYLADRLAVTPIDQFARTDAVGPGTYLNNKTFTEKSGDLVAHRRLRGDVPASTGDVAVWDVFVALETGDGQFVRASVDRVAGDRRTGEAVTCCGEAVDSNPVRHAGVSYKFPFDTGKRTYDWWDVNSQRAYPAKYVSDEDVQGLTTYKFIQQVPGFQLRTQDVPGALVGESTLSVTAPVFYETVRTAWVEPRTGIIIKANEQTRTTLRNSAGQDKVTVVQYDLTFDNATQGRQADLARDGASKIRLVSVWLPLLGLVLGLLLIVAGVLVVRAAGRDTTPQPVDEDPVPVG